jgi:hypothetical protein
MIQANTDQLTAHDTVRDALLAALAPLAVPTGLHPEGKAEIRTEQHIAVYYVRSGMIEVYDLDTCDRVFCSGSQNALLPDVCVPGPWLSELLPQALTAA